MQLADLATDALQHAQQLGAEAGDVIIAAGDSFSASVRLGKVEKILNSREKRMGIRLFVGQSSAITSTANFTREAVHALIEDTVVWQKPPLPMNFPVYQARKNLKANSC
jgi:PmbA protein